MTTNRRLLPILLLLALAACSDDSDNMGPDNNGPTVKTVAIDASQDNTLYENQSGLISNGSGMHMFIGKNSTGITRRSLVMFDIESSTLPAGVTIDSVRLELSVSSANVPVTTSTLHRVTNSWGEGTSDAAGSEGGGAASETNDATWIHRFYDTQTWTSAGGDFEASPSAAVDVGDIDRYTWGSTPQMVADVQGWIDDPSSNHGWLLRGDESANSTAKRLDTRENPTAENRPKLTIFYAEK